MAHSYLELAHRSSISAQLKPHLRRICEDCDVTGNDVTGSDVIGSREPEPEMKGRSIPYTRISRVFPELL
jgi:hypothetical protein